MYLYNKSKNIIDLPTGETLFPGCFSSYISSVVNPFMQQIIRSGSVQVLNDLNRYEAVGYRIPFCYAGNISKSNEFPSRLEVQDGMLYIITADTIDGNPEKTNTGKTFLDGQTIIWYHGDWWELSRCDTEPDYYHWGATYSCDTHTWTVVLVSVDKIGPESDWSCAGLSCTRTTLSSTPPAAPTVTPVCPEQLDIYDSCTESVDIYERCTDPVDLVDIYEVCDDPVPPEVLVDIYEVRA